MSATPDRNIKIPGINKESINNKRYEAMKKILKPIRVQIKLKIKKLIAKKY